MNRLQQVVLSLGLVALTSPAFAADNEVHGAGTTADLECTADEPTAAIHGAGQEITVKGPCTEVTVHGSSNKVTIEAVVALKVQGSSNIVDVAKVTKIALSGTSNQVTWHAGPAPKKKPSIKKSGVGNKVVQAKS